MNRAFLRLTLVVMVAFLGGAPGAPSANAGPDRVRFSVATVETVNGTRTILARSDIEGPPGTDFTIDFHDSRFVLVSRFTTDVEDGGLRVAARLSSKRSVGRSERDLPIYEEDTRRETLRVGFDETMLLLPFGRATGGDSLAIEITPTPIRTPDPSTKLVIDFVKPAPGGFLKVNAVKIPHFFTATLTLLADGRETAAGTAVCRIEETRDITLELPNGDRLIVPFTVEDYTPGCSEALYSCRFDVIEQSAGGNRTTVGAGWRGGGVFGRDLPYDLTMPGGKRYELRVNLQPVKN